MKQLKRTIILSLTTLLILSVGTVSAQRGSRGQTDTGPIISGGAWQQVYKDSCSTYEPLSLTLSQSGDTLTISDPQAGDIVLNSGGEGLFTGVANFTDDNGNAITYDYVLQIDSENSISGIETYTDPGFTETCTIELNYVGDGEITSEVAEIDEEIAEEEITEEETGEIIPTPGTWEFRFIAECAPLGSAEYTLAYQGEDVILTPVSGVTDPVVYTKMEPGVYQYFIEGTDPDSGERFSNRETLFATSDESISDLVEIEGFVFTLPDGTERTTCNGELVLLEAAEETVVDDTDDTETVIDTGDFTEGAWALSYVEPCLELGTNIPVNLSLQGQNMIFDDGTQTIMQPGEPGLYSGTTALPLPNGNQLELAFGLAVISPTDITGILRIVNDVFVFEGNEVESCPFEMTLAQADVDIASNDTSLTPAPDVTPVVQPTPTKPPPDTGGDDNRPQNGVWVLAYRDACIELGVQNFVSIEAGPTGLTLVDATLGQVSIPEVQSGYYEGQVDVFNVGPLQFTFEVISPRRMTGSVYNVNDYFYFFNSPPTDLCFFEMERVG